MCGMFGEPPLQQITVVFRVCNRVCCFLTPDKSECVVRLSELQQAAVFAQFGDEGEETVEQPVRPLLVLLLLDLKHTQGFKDLFVMFQTFRQRQFEGVHSRHRS